MAKKKKAAKKTAKSRRLSQTHKKIHAQVRRIVEKEKIPYWQARRRRKEVFIETIRRSHRKAKDTWFKVGETKTGKSQYRRVKPEDLPKIGTRKDIKKYTYGARKRHADVQKSIGLYQYWGLVNRLALTFDLTTDKARKLLTAAKNEMTRVARAHGINRVYRSRDAAAVLINTDRYQNIRMEFGI